MGAETFLHFRILGPLGQGGMGEVFLAEDERLGRRVALKFLPRSTASDPEAQERLRREARSLAVLSHPHIASIHSLESDADRSCLVMEYVEGETLAARIARRPLPIPEVMAAGTAIAGALAHAHAKGVIHRDVKPANILVTPAGVAKLTDFGIARLEDATQLTAEGYTPGTVAYMSPEQARGGPIDGRSDIFALGAVLYEALTGVRAFAADRPEATLLAIQRQEPEPPSALRSGIPLELERIVLKCLKKDAALRYQHADDLAADFRALSAASESATAAAVTGAAGGGSATAAPAPPAEERRRRLLRNAIPIAIVSAAVAFYVFGPYRPSLKPEPPAAEAAQKSIAVLSFQNLAEPGDPNGTAPIATSLLTVALGESQLMPVLSTQRIHDVLRHMGKPNEVVKGTDALDVARRAGAAYVVTGFIYAIQPEVVLAAEVASTSDGTVLTAGKIRTAGGAQGLYAAVDSLTTLLRDGFARSGFGVRQTPIDVASLTTRSPSAFRAYVRGLDLLHRGEWSQAARAFRSAIAADSSFALAWYHAALATWWDEDKPAAQAEVRAALRLGDRLSGREREGLRALGALIGGDYEGAARQYRDLLRRFPDDKEFLYGLAEALYHGTEDEAGALQTFERVTAIDPSFGVAYLHVVDIRMSELNLPAARTAAEGLVRGDPENPLGYLVKSHVALLMGDAPRALSDCRDALARDPRCIMAISGIGYIHGMMGNFDSTRAAIAAMSRLGGPEGAKESRVDELFLLVLQGRFRETERLAGLLAKEPAPGESYHGIRPRGLRASVLSEMERWDESLGEWDTFWMEFRRIGSSRCGPLCQVVEVLIRANRLHEADARVKACQRELGRSGTLTERRIVNAAAGLLALARGRAREAIAIFERDHPSGPPLARYWLRRQALANALLAAGDKTRAMTELEAAVKTVPGCGHPIEAYKAMNLLAKLYEERGRRDEALALYKRVAWQYRMAEPGVKANEEALEGIQRLSKPS